MDISQSGVYPLDPSVPAAGDPAGICGGSAERFILRARTIGARPAQRLWADAPDQVDKGLVGKPLKIDAFGKIATFGRNPTVVAFRLADVEEMGRIRDCDDLKYSTTNLYCAV